MFIVIFFSFYIKFTIFLYKIQKKIEEKITTELKIEINQNRNVLIDFDDFWIYRIFFCILSPLSKYLKILLHYYITLFIFYQYKYEVSRQIRYNK